MLGRRYYYNILSLSALCFATTLLTFNVFTAWHQKVVLHEQQQKKELFYNVSLQDDWCVQARILTHIKIPELKNTYQLLDECEISEYAVYRSIYIFYENWKHHFGDSTGKVRETIDNVLIQWGDKRRTVAGAYDINGKFIQQASVTGLALSPSHVWVKRGEKGIGTSSLIHELVHITLWNLYGSADPTHEGGEDNIWTDKHTQFIKETNNLLFLIGDNNLADPNYSMDILRAVMESTLRNGKEREKE
mgnify:FL=1